MDASVIITTIICVTVLSICCLNGIVNILSSKYDHENIITSEKEEK